jgi:electron transport complex protein RnfC
LLQPVPVAPRLWVPLAVRGPAPAAKPVGTAVRRGEPLTETVAEGTAAALAPADGRVMAVEQVQLLDGRMVPAVVLDTSPDASVQESPPPPADPEPSPDDVPAPNLFGELTASERSGLIETFRLGGVSADRWSSPDLLGQLHQSLRRPVDTVLCTVLDIDRALPVQSMLAQAYGAELAAGVDLVSKAAGATRTWVTVDSALPEALQASLRVHLDKVGARLVPLRNDYPQANPTLLLYTVLGRRLPPQHLPTETGVLTLDAAAAVALGRLARQRQPMLSTPLALFDGRGDRVHFLSVPIGTSLAHVLGHLSIVPELLVLRGGPPLRDIRVGPGAVIAASELSAYTTLEDPERNPDPCIRCGWCVEGCPVHIHPAALLEAVQFDDMDQADDAGLHACIDCGVCSYICPSRLPLLGGIRMLRKRWTEKMEGR